MPDISQAMQAKSDQLNALDIVGSPLTIRVRDVDYNPDRDQPVWIYFDGDNNRPWKPSKGMIRIIGGAWGKMTEQWIGKYALLQFEPSVTWAGKEVGGIWATAFSDIPEKGMNFSLALNRQKRIPFPVNCLKVEATPYPADRFEKALPAMTKKMQDGEMTLQQVIAQCQKTGQLSAEQTKRLEEAAPVEVQDHDEDEM